jgi:hypothetical protein
MIPNNKITSSLPMILALFSNDTETMYRGTSHLSPITSSDLYSVLYTFIMGMLNTLRTFLGQNKRLFPSFEMGIQVL